MSHSAVSHKTGLILLEDEPVLAQELAEFLEEFGYNATCTHSLAEFNAAFEITKHPLAVIDLGLPDGDGLELIAKLRKANPNIGLVAFTARATTQNRLTGFNQGVDYYLTKGCDLFELTAVLDALKRRVIGIKEVGIWQLDLRPNELTAPNGKTLRLSHQECVVLHSFMRSAGKPVSKREVIEALDSDYLSYDLRRLDTQIHRLRRNVEQATGLTLPLKTLRNNGYSFFEAARILTLAETA